ncbi:hypothetical protein [Streptomyces sp. GbtcB6]|uniref:hypothetical protein n=1 Tax=Streptomyces sp. GbtcB6 TaxID=2824751 RepID=UPI001C30689D|nr:hypothetical protein [Streptomyces sp. GbtcB6]
MDFRIDQWDIAVRPWGWIRLREISDEGPTVYLHYEVGGSEGQHRLELQAVVLRSSAKEPLSGRVWRRIPFAEIERALTFIVVNPPPPPTETIERSYAQAREIFMDGVEGFVPPSLDSLDDFFEATENLTSMYFNPMPSGMLVSEDHGRLPHIKQPEGRITDDFLQDVADAYRWFADRDKAPAPSIAELSGAPVRTVHRWVYEARKRGILPPARTGRAG